MSGGGFLNIKMKRGDVVRVGHDIIIEVKSEGESSIRVSVTAPRETRILIERGIPSPFHGRTPSDI